MRNGIKGLAGVGRALVSFRGRARRDPRSRGGCCPVGNLSLRTKISQTQELALRPPAGLACDGRSQGPRSNAGVASWCRRAGSMYSIFAARHRLHLMEPRKWRKPGRKVVQVKACILPGNKQAPEVESISNLARDKTSPAVFDLQAPRWRSNRYVKQVLFGNYFLKNSA